jgi:hypothetical protein
MVSLDNYHTISAKKGYGCGQLDIPKPNNTGKEIQILFRENLGRDHTETLQVSIEPAVGKIHVYDKFLNEIPSFLQIQGDKVIVTFTLQFKANEEKKTLHCSGKSSNGSCFNQRALCPSYSSTTLNRTTAATAYINVINIMIVRSKISPC